MASEAHSKHSAQRDAREGRGGGRVGRGKQAVTQLELSRRGRPSRLSQTKNLVLWISWKPRGSAERKVPCLSYQNIACPDTSGLAVSEMGALVLAELCKDAHFPQRVPNCGAIFGHSRASGTKLTWKHRNFTLSFGLWFPSDTAPAQKVRVTGHT